HPAPPHLHSFPTRRSSDLSVLPFRRTATLPLQDSSSPGQRTRTFSALSSPRKTMPIRGPTSSVAPSTAAALWLVWPLLGAAAGRSEEHTSELQSRFDLVCR